MRAVQPDSGQAQLTEYVMKLSNEHTMNVYLTSALCSNARSVCACRGLPLVVSILSVPKEAWLSAEPWRSSIVSSMPEKLFFLLKTCNRFGTHKIADVSGDALLAKPSGRHNLRF